MSKSKTPKLSFKHLISFLTFVLVAIVIHNNWSDILTALDHIRETNLLILFLIVPEQMVMLFSGAEIFFSYINARRFAKIPKSVKRQGKSKGSGFVSKWEKMRITLETNFVRQTIPSAGFSGTAYMSWRLQRYGSSVGQTTFIYLLRYFAIVCSNQLQTLFAAFCLVLATDLTRAGQTIVLIAALIALGTGFLLGIAIFLVSKKRRMMWIARKGVRLLNVSVRTLTFGKRREILSVAKVEKVLTDLHESYLVAKENKKILKKPVLWGVIYSIFEISSYWIVAMSLGHPEILPQIMIGEAVGSVAGAFVPYGLYELGMAGAMSALGVNIGVGSLVVVITRVLTLGETFTLGYFFYQKTLHESGAPSFLSNSKVEKNHG